MDATPMYPAQLLPTHPPPPKKRKKERKKDADCPVSTLNTAELRHGSLSWAGEWKINK